MEQTTTEASEASRVMWETLEDFVRGKVQQMLQTLLDEEITELLGRRRYERN